MHKTTGVAYQEDPDGTHHTLSVFAPVGDGRPWPTAVMIHGAGEPDYFYPWARNVARRGVVVFVPHWRYIDEPTPQQFRDSVEAESSQLTCAVRFARAETDRFGGDPGYLSLFGHSFGANLAARIVFAEPEVAPGCAASADATAPDNLVLTDGDWLAIGWGSLLRKDPELLEIVAPWSHLSSAPPRIQVHILDTGDRALNTRDSGYGAPGTWLPLRDPTGDLQRGLERRKAFADGTVTETEIEQLLYDELKLNGYQATFHTLGTTHMGLNQPAQLRILVDSMLADR